MTGIIAPIYVIASGPHGTPAIADVTIGGDGSRPSYALHASGDIFICVGGAGDVSADSGDDWIAPLIGMDQFEVRATLVSGDGFVSGASSALATWLSLAADQIWVCRLGTPMNPLRTCVLTVEIRPIGGVTVTSATVDMTGEFLG